MITFWSHICLSYIVLPLWAIFGVLHLCFHDIKLILVKCLCKTSLQFVWWLKCNIFFYFLNGEGRRGDYHIWLFFMVMLMCFHDKLVRVKLRNPSPDLSYLALPITWALELALTCFSSLSSLSGLSGLSHSSQPFTQAAILFTETDALCYLIASVVSSHITIYMAGWSEVTSLYNQSPDLARPSLPSPIPNFDITLTLLQHYFDITMTSLWHYFGITLALLWH